MKKLQASDSWWIILFILADLLFASRLFYPLTQQDFNLHSIIWGLIKGLSSVWIVHDFFIHPDRPEKKFLDLKKSDIPFLHLFQWKDLSLLLPLMLLTQIIGQAYIYIFFSILFSWQGFFLAYIFFVLATLYLYNQWEIWQYRLP